MIKKNLFTFILILTVPILFFMIASVHLEGQGLYYDEPHQAPAAFSFVGKTPEFFTRLSIGNFPVLNVFYIGAMKSAVYGLYLKFTGASFGVVSWRLLGILFTSLGILLFSLIAYRTLSLPALCLFLFLVVTDITVILMSRHDWGPMALSLSFRLIFLGLWLKAAGEENVSKRNTFFLGFLVSLAVFDKLISVVFLFPLLIILLTDSRRHSFRHLSSVLLGLFFGGIPLLIANGYSFLTQGNLISLTGYQQAHSFEISELAKLFCHLISQGDGVAVTKYILGSSGEYFQVTAENIILGLSLALSGVLAFHYRKTSRSFRLSGIMLGCFIIVGFALYMLPKSNLQHWLLATPFQYAAVMLTLKGLQENRDHQELFLKIARKVFLIFMMVLIVSRIFGWVKLEKALLREDAAPRFDRSLTEMGYFAKTKTQEAIFIAADWGVAVQIYLMTNGTPNFVHEIFKDYSGVEDIKAIVKNSGKEAFYAVTLNPVSSVAADKTEHILNDLENISDWLPGWREVPAEEETLKFQAVKIRKFQLE